MQDKVLLISPEFFNYQIIFKRGIEELGFSCDWYSDRPSSQFLTKAALRLTPFIVKNKTDKYLVELLNKTKNIDYKYIMVVMGEALNDSFISALRERYSQAKFIYVFWDAIANFNMGLKFVHYFDRVYTTDRKDAEKYGFNFIPLFYNDYIDTTPKKLKYDYSFIGTIKKGKNRKLNLLIEEMQKEYDRAFIYKYLQGKSVWLYYKIRYSEEFKKEGINKFHYEKLDSHQTIDIVKSSRFVLDVPMNDQTALTERCFNALYLKRKLITTNEDIANYDFYDSTNIFIYKEGEIINFDSPFFQTAFKPMKNFEKYSLNHWLKTLLLN